MRRAKGLQGQNALGITLQLAAADKVFFSAALEMHTCENSGQDFFLGSRAMRL